MVKQWIKQVLIGTLLAAGCERENPPVRYLNIDYTIQRPSSMTLGVLQDSVSQRALTFLCIDHPPSGSVDEVVEFEQSNLKHPESVAELYFQGLTKEREIRHFTRPGFQGKTLVKSSFTETLSSKKLERYQLLLTISGVSPGSKLLYFNPAYQLEW